MRPLLLAPLLFSCAIERSSVYAHTQTERCDGAHLVTEYWGDDSRLYGTLIVWGGCDEKPEPRFQK